MVRNHVKWMWFFHARKLSFLPESNHSRYKWNLLSLKDLKVRGETLSIPGGLGHGKWDESEGSCSKPHDVYQRSTQFVLPLRRQEDVWYTFVSALYYHDIPKNIAGGQRWMVVQTSKWMGRILVWQTCHIWQRQSENCASVSSLKFFCSNIKTEQCCHSSSTVWCHQTRMVTNPWRLTLRTSHLRCLQEGISSTLEFSLCSVTVCPEAQMLLWLLKHWGRSLPGPTAKRGFYWGKEGKEGSVSGEGFWMAWI